MRNGGHVMEPAALYASRDWLPTSGGEMRDLAMDLMNRYEAFGREA